jgi:4-amino-4-deoxy-L-arabinose transferase-like glycosyltransferase
MSAGRWLDYPLLLLIGAWLLFPNLGASSLWDMDEGVNAEAGREMWVSENYITPYFNYQLRVAKPVMAYWLQSASYSCFGVNEFAARFPSALAGLLTILLLYEFGRYLYDQRTGRLAAIILGTCFQFLMLTHAATVDAILLFFTVATYFGYWLAIETKKTSWLLLTGITSGLAVLTKGPVGVVLPGLVILLFHIWNRDWKILFTRPYFWASLCFWVTALPWYIMVTIDTRGAWIRGFVGKNNLSRFMEPQENHSGPIVYYLFCLLIFFAPWSIILIGTIWNGFRETRLPVNADTPTQNHRRARFLILWVMAYLCFFSLAATKLPNYIFPVYPAVALLTARLLYRWSYREATFPNWFWWWGWGSVFFTGILFTFGLLIISGSIPVPGKFDRLSGLENWAWIGIIEMVAAGLIFYFMRQDRRNAIIQTLAVSAVLFSGITAGFPVIELDRHKAVKTLVMQSGAFNPDREMRLASFYYFQESLVFYSQREVKPIDNAAKVNEFLSLRIPVYLFAKKSVWEEALPQITEPYSILASAYDFTKRCEVLVISNDVK